MSLIPLSPEYREQLVLQLLAATETRDPLVFVQKQVFAGSPGHSGRIPRPNGGTPADFFEALVRYCEVSAWSEFPPLLAALLKAFLQVQPQYENDIRRLLEEGPFQCHPTGQPFWVARIAADLPLLGRWATRAAAIGFGEGVAAGSGKEGKRVLRVWGPEGSGKTYTREFFRYLAAIQPMQAGVVEIDFADREMATQAADAKIPVELFLAQRLQAQVRQVRAGVARRKQVVGGALPHPAALLPPPGEAFSFRQLANVKQRARWAGELAGEFVDQVIYRLKPEPAWWVVVFDNCGNAPAGAQEFVRRLVQRAAGTDPPTIWEADAGQLRVVLLGDSTSMLPSPVYGNHIQTEDLTGQQLDREEVVLYFQAFAHSRAITLEAERIETLAQESLARARQIVAESNPPPPWPRALATAVIEKTLPLEALAEKKRSET